MKIGHVLALLWCLLAGPLAAETWRAGDVAEAEAAFAAAEAGDRIELAPGRYGAMHLAGRDFAAPVTVASADPGARALLTETLGLSEVANVVVEGIDIRAAGLAERTMAPRLSVERSRDVTLRDIAITGHVPTAADGGVRPDTPGLTGREVIAGHGYDTGVEIRDSHDVTVRALSVREARKGVHVHGSRDVTLTGLSLTALREGINLTDSRGIEIAESRIWGLRPWKPDSDAADHPDMIQFWGRGTARGVQDLTIRDNLLVQRPEDPHSQTIHGSMDGAEPTARAANFTITGNVIVNGHRNAISLSDVEGAVISDNLLLPKSSEFGRLPRVEVPAIVLRDVSNVEVTGNMLLAGPGQLPFTARADLAASGAIRHSGNRLLDFRPSSPLYWRRYLPRDLAARLAAPQ